jgi:hypothetical protein
MKPYEHAQLLLAIVRGRWDEAEALVRLGPVCASTFVDLCMEGDVPTWVHGRLAAEERSELVGPEVMDRLAAVRTRVRRDNLLLIARAEQALGALVDAGVVPVALKGLDLLFRVYENFDERTLDDVDLLIRPQELTRAIAALEALGFELPPEPTRTHYLRSSHHLPMKSPGPVSVDFEIHWNLAQEMRYAIDEDGLHGRAVPVEIGGRQILRLDDHDIVAHLLLHHFTHYFDRRLKWAVDLGIVAGSPGFDWSVVVERIRSWDAVASSGVALMHLHKMVPEWIPDQALRGIHVSAWRRALLAPLRSGHPLDMFRDTRRRWVQLYIAAVLLEDPLLMPRWLLHRLTRDRQEGSNPLDGDEG